MRTTKLETETQTIISNIPGLAMKRSKVKIYNRAVFDLYYKDVCIGTGLTCNSLQDIAMVFGNMLLMNAGNKKEYKESKGELMLVA